MAGAAKKLDPQDEIARLLAIQIRRSIGSQDETIAVLGRAGFGPSRIAELLGTSVPTVGVALARAKKRKKGK